MPREGMGSGTEVIVDCHGQVWAVARGREGRGTEVVVVCHDPGWVVAKGKEGHGTARACGRTRQGGLLHEPARLETGCSTATADPGPVARAVFAPASSRVLG